MGECQTPNQEVSGSNLGAEKSKEKENRSFNVFFYFFLIFFKKCGLACFLNVYQLNFIIFTILQGLILHETQFTFTYSVVFD